MLIPALLKQYQQIAYMTGESNYTRIHFVDAPPQIHARTLGYFAELLPEFVRIHKTYLVNPSHITDYRASAAKKVNLQVLAQWLPISRHRIKEVMPMLERALTVDLITQRSLQDQKTKTRLSQKSKWIHKRIH